MVHAVNTLISSGKTEVTEADIDGALYTAHSPYPDLLVRTAGEYRLSNFLLWQLAYSELYFTDILWPDLSNDQLDDIIRSFYNRNRTYGGLKGGDKGANTSK
jgi:undecaprenyl diphosphate synthase